MTRLRTARLKMAALLLSTACAAVASRETDWSAAEVEELRSLWIGALEPLEPDPSNRVADDPRAAALGHRLFFDARLSSNGQVSCATCHKPDREFQDDAALATGVGTTTRRTMPIAGTAHQPFHFWDGRKDSQWAQALGPLESAVEHGGSRAQYAHIVARYYRDAYEALFGPLPDLSSIPERAGPVEDSVARRAWDALAPAQQDVVTGVFVNIGKAIAAYERRIEFGESRFDRYVAELVRTGRAPASVLTQDEVAGLRLFIGKANCTQCHNGPLFTDQHFHNTGVAAVPSLPQDRGRLLGAQQVLADEFNCRSRWSDAPAESCVELEFLNADDHALDRAYKPPTLRNVAERPPYMHAGQIATLEEVVDHYNRAPGAPAGHSELEPLRLSARERAQLVAYLRTLSGGTRAADGALLGAPQSAGAP